MLVLFGACVLPLCCLTKLTKRCVHSVCLSVIISQFVVGNGIMNNCCHLSQPFSVCVLELKNKLVSCLRCTDLQSSVWWWTSWFDKPAVPSHWCHPPRCLDPPLKNPYWSTSEIYIMTVTSSRSKCSSLVISTELQIPESTVTSNA